MPQFLVKKTSRNIRYKYAHCPGISEVRVHLYDNTLQTLQASLHLQVSSIGFLFFILAYVAHHIG